MMGSEEKQQINYLVLTITKQNNHKTNLKYIGKPHKQVTLSIQCLIIHTVIKY